MRTSKELILQVKNISKQYRLGTIGTGTLADDLKRWWYTARGKDDPFLKIGETNDRSSKGESEYVWSLKDIKFDVYKGDVLGIIGKNGAGKSTLLKILSKVTSPTTGSIKSNGRIASLLEVGTGFHPELTGRENIYLNGAILGMTKKEIASKLDEIIEFSGCERYIDTPTKRYSSGMTVRLAFAVAAFLEPDILIVDEVLAVGDAEFQKKAIGKMKDISSGDNGRTVLFVSHNMAAVKSLCSRSLVLENGEVAFDGTTNDAIDFYLQSNQYEGYISNYTNINLNGSGFVQLDLLDKNNNNRTEYGFDESVNIKIKVKVNEDHLDSFIGIKVIDGSEVIIFTTQIQLSSFISQVGTYEFIINLPSEFLIPNNFTLSFGMHIPNVLMIDYHECGLSFEIVETGSDFHIYKGKDFGCVFVNCDWTLVNN
jgi:lipopolysaccharide transport system ATP-binding protein